jgi:hypothetical protein
VAGGSKAKCPLCRKQSSGVHILPLSLGDVDEKLKMPMDSSRSSNDASVGKKRSSDGCEFTSKALPITPTIESSSLLANERTGRWTSNEVSYVDALVAAFDSGALLINDGTKLHDFLTGMLKCKLSRLTKKFKSANFTRGYTRHEGGATGKTGMHLRRVLTSAYEKFIASQFNTLAQAEMRILTAAEWRTYLVDYCKLCLDKPVEEMSHLDVYVTSTKVLDSRIEVLQEQSRKRRKLDITSGRARPNIAAAHLQQSPVHPFQPIQPHAGGVGGVNGEEDSALDYPGRPASDSFGESSCFSFDPFQGANSASNAQDFSNQDLEPVPVASDNFSVAKLASTAPNFPTAFEHTGGDKTTDEEFLSLWEVSKGDEALVTDDEVTGCSVSISDSLHKGGGSCHGNKFRNPYFSLNPLQQQQAGTYQVEVGIIASLARHVSQNQQLPFEYYDLWTPKIDPATSEARLVFAGSHFANASPPPPQLMRFASFSSTFDFKVGTGMPGRVFASRQPCWEQQVQYAHSEHFKRAEGAAFAGIQTAVGIPMVCSRTGSILVIGCYSRRNIQRNDELVYKLWTEFSSFTTAAMSASASIASSASQSQPPRAISQVKMIKQPTMQAGAVRSCTTREELITLLAEQIPIGVPSSSADSLKFVNGFMHLRMLLLRAPKYSPQSADGDMVRLICNSYSLYKATGQRSRQDLASVVVREYLLLTSGAFSLSPSMAPPQPSPAASVASAKMMPYKTVMVCLGRDHSKSTSTEKDSVSSRQ